MGMHFSFKNKNRLKPNRSWHQGVYAQLATEEEGVERGDGGNSLPRQQNNKGSSC